MMALEVCVDRGWEDWEGCGGRDWDWGGWEREGEEAIGLLVLLLGELRTGKKHDVSMAPTAIMAAKTRILRMRIIFSSLRQKLVGIAESFVSIALRAIFLKCFP